MRIAQQAKTHNHASFQQESTAMVCVAWFAGGSAGWTWTGPVASAGRGTDSQTQASMSIYEVAIAQARLELAQLATQTTRPAAVTSRNLFQDDSQRIEKSARLTLDAIITLN